MAVFQNIDLSGVVAGGHADQPAKGGREVALAAEAGRVGDVGNRLTLLEKSLCLPDAPRFEIGVRRQADGGAKNAQQVIGIPVDQRRQIVERDVVGGMFVDARNCKTCPQPCYLYGLLAQNRFNYRRKLFGEPLSHYLSIGRQQGLNPSKDFSVR